MMSAMRFALLCSLLALPALAADDDRGPRGLYVASGGGVAVGSALDGSGDDAGSFFGNGGYLRIGEEALPGLTLGLFFGGGGGQAGSEDYSAGVGGFALQVGWRAVADVVFTGGIGVGGGSLTAEVDDGPEGSAGGSFYTLGAAYEFKLSGGEHDGFGIAPAVTWMFVPDFEGSPARLSTFLIGVDGFWYAGRSER